MRTFHRATNLPGDTSPRAWLHCVLPQNQETHRVQYDKAHQALTQNRLDDACTIFCDADGPAGLAAVRTEGRTAHLVLIAVRADKRRCGLGTELLQRALAACRTEQLQALVATDVHSRNEAATGLFEKSNFFRRSQGSLRMRRPLDGARSTTAASHALRPLRAGEEEAWIDLKNACFREDGGEHWRVDDFKREFVDSPIFALNRILVATVDGQLTGTTSAWEGDYGWGPVGLIHWVGVDPRYRGKGLGGALLTRALDELAARGYADAWLSTSRDRHAAVRLYERQGFTVEREFLTYTLEL